MDVGLDAKTVGKVATEAEDQRFSGIAPFSVSQLPLGSLQRRAAATSPNDRGAVNAIRAR